VQNIESIALQQESGLLVLFISMAGNSRTTFTKRQKERARLDKRAEKEQRKAERKQVGTAETATDTQPVADLVVTYDEEGQPEGFNFHDFGKP